jgi:outer membrane protein assembly factor BamE
MVLQRETALLCNRLLARLDLGVVELLDAAAGQAQQVVVVLALVQLEHRLAALEMAARQQPRLLELQQHAVDGGQADVGMLGQQQLVHVLGGHVALLGALENFQDFQARQGCLEAAALELVDAGHGVAKIARIIASDAPMHRTVLFIGLAASAALAGCSSMQPTTDKLLGVITPYRIDIMQGNVVTKEQADLVKPGMAKEQVRDLLGSPLLSSPFHADRWDYVFTLRRQGVEPQRRSIVATFDKDGKLVQLDAPDLPSEREFVSSVRPAKSGGKEPVLALTDEQKKSLPPPVKTETPAGAQPQGATRTYPPLEPT